MQVSSPVSWACFGFDGQFSRIRRYGGNFFPSGNGQYYVSEGICDFVLEMDALTH
jgi:hypothetical protein